MSPPFPGTTVITGLGFVGAPGAGSEALAAALASGPPRLSEAPRERGYHRPRSAGSRLGCRVAGADLSPWLSPRAARRMSPPSKYASAAARMALEQAGWATQGKPWPAKEAPEAIAQAAVILATAFGPSSFTEGLMRQILLEGPAATSPFFFTESVANAAAAQVALTLGARGPNLTITQREAGPLQALARAAGEVAAGRVPLALAGAVDELDELLHAVLDRFGALAGGPGGEVARPFDRRRNGFLVGEGSAVLVLEPEAAARKRSAPILARASASASAFDPTAPVAGWSRDPGILASALERLLATVGGPEAIDRIVSTASGSRAGDHLEASILNQVWAAQPLPPVLAPKATTGEYAGGHLASGVLAASGVPFAATPGFSEIDPDLDLVPYDGRPLPSPRRLLLSALAAGGAATWIVLEAADLDR